MTGKFHFERLLEMVIEGDAMVQYHVQASVPQASPVSRILLAIDISEQTKWGEVYVSQAEGISLVDNLRWVATGRNINQVVTMLDRCVAWSIVWASRRGLQFDKNMTEPAQLSPSRCNRYHVRRSDINCC